MVARVSKTALSSITLCVAIIRRFLSTASATTPPTSEQIMIGAPRNKPTRPSANADLVSTYTCQLIATNCICDPVTETIWPNQSKRKSRWRRAAKEERVLTLEPGIVDPNLGISQISYMFGLNDSNLASLECGDLSPLCSICRGSKHSDQGETREDTT